MHKLFKGFALAAVSLSFAGAAFAADHGTKEEAAAMVKKAVSYAKTNGKDKLLAEVTNGSKGQFVDRDLYVSVWSPDAKVLAHATNPKLVGTDVSDLKDADGKPFMKEILTKASGGGSGWVDYKWANPVTKEVQPKSAYFEKVDDMIISTGYYKK